MVNLSLQAVAAYVARNKEPPLEIVIFHNSVSGDQMSLFLDFFVKNLKTKLADVYGEKTPSLTLVLVNVRTS